MKILQVVESAYRGTIEEQDDTILWLSHSMIKAGAAVSLLLENNAANYAVAGQDSSGLQFGGWKQTNPPKIDRDLAAIADTGAKVYVFREDLAERGISPDTLIPGIELCSREALPELFEQHDTIWRW